MRGKTGKTLNEFPNPIRKLLKLSVYGIKTNGCFNRWSLIPQKTDAFK